MAIGTATALIGSAVIGAGATAYGASQASKAAKKAQQSADRAAEQQLQLQREQMNLARQLNEPFRQGGLSAFDALLREYGLGGSGQAASGGQPQTLPASGPYVPQTPSAEQGVWNAYLQAYPDVMAWAQSGHGDPSRPIEEQSMEERAAYHFRNSGQAEGRQLPTVAPASGTPEPAPTPAGPQTPTDLMTAARPDAPPPPTRQRAPDMQFNDPGGFGSFSFDASRIAEDPGYKFRLSEGLKGVNAASAARGKLRSGDAAMALQARADGLASQETMNAFGRQLQGWQANANQFNADRAFDWGQHTYGQNRQDANFADDRAYDTGLWQYGVQRQDNNFNTDRGYQTQQNNTRLGNLFNLAGMGQAAAGAVTGAGSNYANNAGNIFGSQAQAAQDAAYARANANSQLVGGLASAAGNLFGAWGGGSRGGPASNVGSVNFGNSLNNPFGRSYTF